MASDKLAVAEAIDINAIMRKATRDAETKSGLSSVLLRREAFAASAISTGSLCLDKILGGGIPACRIIGISGPERSGKTLLATQIGANHVAKYRFLNYMDAEGSTDPIFLAARGIDFEKYRGKRNKAGDLKPGEVDYVNFYQPSTVEQITNYIHTLSAALPESRNPPHPVCVYVLDSVVALITDELDENIIDANKMAMHAKAYATYLPVINSDLVKSGSTLIYTNQLRQKPMVTYGCLQANTPIPLVDGRVFSIQKIVDDKIEGEVWSYCNVEKKLKPAKIVNWFDNGECESSNWVHIKTEGPGSGNGLYSIIVTKNHKVLRSDGEWVEAKNLTIDDMLMTKYEETIEPGSLAEQFLVGNIIGDSTIPKNQRNKNILMLTNGEQKEYLDWKVSKLQNIFDFNYHALKNGNSGKRSDQYITKPNICLGVLTQEVFYRNPLPLLPKLSWLSVAVWYMDDGSSNFSKGHCQGVLSLKRLKNNQLALDGVVSWFKSHGVDCAVSKNKTTIRFNKFGFLKLCDAIARYVPNCMQYKLPESHRGRYQDFEILRGTKVKALPVRILEIKNGLGHRCSRKYDLGIENNHNYLAGHTRGGLIVHNSNLYEPAGDALKFFSAVRMMLGSAKPKIDDKDHPFLEKEVIPGVTPRENGVWEESHIDRDGNIIGLDKYIYTGIKTVKNKVFTPFQKCWIRIQFEENGSTGHGLDPVFDIFTFLLEEGYIAPSKNEKGKNLKGRYDAYSCDQFDPVKEIDMPNEFDYFEFKRWVTDNPGLTEKIRDKLLVSGIVYSKEDTIKIDENVKKEAEEAGEIDEAIEAGDAEVVKKKGGRPKKS